MIFDFCKKHRIRFFIFYGCLLITLLALSDEHLRYSGMTMSAFSFLFFGFLYMLICRFILKGENSYNYEMNFIFGNCFILTFFVIGIIKHNCELFPLIYIIIPSMVMSLLCAVHYNVGGGYGKDVDDCL